MPNPYHFRARIDRLWRRSEDHNPGYIRVNALDAITRELFVPTDQARRNHQLYLATDPYDVARHHLRDLYDGPDTGTSPDSLPLPLPLPPGEACPALDAGGWGEGSPAFPEDETIDEDDDPL